MIHTEDSMTKISEKCKTFLFKSKIMTAKDYLIVSILIVVFSILVFLRLGNTYAPQSYYEATYDDRDIVIDFGDYVDVTQLHIYLGNLDNRRISLSAFNEVTGAWELINPEINVSSVFQWNKVDIYYNLRYLGIVSLEDDGAVFNEFVFIGPTGSIVTPANTDRYPALFDEQEMFPKTFEATYMDGTMFDEVYHGRTGYEFVHGLPTYETTHPMLGKCIIALGIKLFGMTPFGWRFFVALFGIMLIPLMYLFAKRLFDNTFAATAVGIYITFDCMHYTLSRIATIDIISAFFIVACYYFMYVYIERDYAGIDSPYPPLALSGIFMGLAISTKLTGVYAALGLAVILLVHLIRKWPKGRAFRLFWFCFFFFIITPLVLYILAYIPSVEKYAQMGITDKTVTWDENGLYIGYGWTGLLARTARNTNYMINYHRNLVAEHYYASPFYEWPLVWMPLLAANSYVDAQNTVSCVSYIGNIAVWWAAFPCAIFIFIRTIIYLFRIKNSQKKRHAVYKRNVLIPGTLLIGYLFQYVPWFGISRISFIYHYLPAMMFNILIMGYTVKIITERWKKASFFVNIYIIVVIAVFCVFFPVISGFPVSKSYAEMLKLLPEWIIVL